MIRLTFALAAWISVASVAMASIAAPKKSHPLANEILRTRDSKLLNGAQEQAAQRTPRTEFVVTDQTEILLDGKPCKYADVPSRASIVHMELATDKKTVLRIHFQSEN
jgi:hypothetical protein